MSRVSRCNFEAGIESSFFPKEPLENPPFKKPVFRDLTKSSTTNFHPTKNGRQLKEGVLYSEAMKLGMEFLGNDFAIWFSS